MSRSRRSLAIACAAAVGATAAPAAPAAAATLTTPACVPSMGTTTNARTLAISGSGFTPGARVAVDYSTPVTPGRTFLTALIADATGAFSTRAVPPLFHAFSTREQVFDLTASTEEPPVEARTRYRQVLFGYEMAPRATSSTRVVRHVVRGFPAGRTTFLHYRLAGRTEGTVRLGRTTSPCGIATRRMRALPFKVKTGTWTVYADQRRAFSLRTRPQAQLTFVVRGR